MRIVSKILTWLIGILLVLSTGFQVLALVSILMQGSKFTQENPWLVPTWILFLTLLAVAFVLTICLQGKDKWLLVPLITGVIAAVLALVVALALKDAFPPQVSSTGGTQGLTVWRLCYRHYSSTLVGVLIALNAAIEMAICRDVRKRRENNEYKSQFDLSGEQLFHDSTSYTIDSHPMKRSQRHALKKAQAAAEAEGTEED